MLFRGLASSVGSVGTAYDKALRQWTIVLFKDECIRSGRHFLNVPLIQLADVARATRGWVHSYNTVRLHSPLASVPPDEFEQINYAKLDPSSNEATVRRRDKLSDPNMGSKESERDKAGDRTRPQLTLHERPVAPSSEESGATSVWERPGA